MSNVVNLTTPLTEEKVRSLKMGDQVFITGIIYTGRDAAHKLLLAVIDKGEKLPVDLDGQIIYFVGPSPAKPGKAIGSAGPTTSYRMDAYSPTLMNKAGLRGMIGKGSRNEEVINTMKEKLKFPDCSKDCEVVKMLGVGECESVCPEKFKKSLSNMKVIMSVDRLDYTKGIINRLQGYKAFLDKYPEWHKKVVLVMIVVPSRVGVEHYQDMQRQIDELVGNINGKFGTIDWTPALYQNKFLSLSLINQSLKIHLS